MTDNCKDRGSASGWDARYAAAPAGLFGEAPNEGLRMLLARGGAAPRTALMLADGDGRNGSWLAEQGLAVTAVDFSAEATRRAKARDRAAGVWPERIAADLRQWQPPTEQRWDLVTLLYLQGPADLRRHALRLGAACLGPGGVLLVEGFAGRPAPGAPGPEEGAARYELTQTLGWVPDLTVLEALEGRILLDEGPRHAGLADVLRLILRRA